MAFRTPFQSGLRDLADSLLRQAETKRRDDEIQAQLEAQQDLIGADLFSNVFNTISQTTQNIAADRQQRIQEEGGRALTFATSDLNTARQNLARLQALNAPPDAIANAQRLVNELTGVVNAPLADVSAGYQRVMGGQFIPERTIPAAISAVPGALPETSRLPGAAPTITFPGMTGADVLTSGMGTVEALTRVAGIQDVQIQAILNDLNNINPSDPNSVYRARAAADQVALLPPDIRASVAPQAQRAINFFDVNPEAQVLYDQAKRVGAAQVTSAETTAARQQEELDAFRENRPLEFRALQGRVGDESATRVVNAFNSGVLTGLSDNEKNEVATLAGVDAAGLPEWASGRVAESERRRQITNELAELELDLANQQVTIGGQTIDFNNLRYNATEWQLNRDKHLAAIQDETTIATGIANASLNNDTAMLAFYIEAWANPNSALGTQMRAMLPANYGDELQSLYDKAFQLRGLQEQSLLYDTQARGVAVDSARLSLARQEALQPVEIAALRARYQLEEASATVDILQLPMTTMLNTTQSLTQLAQAVPSSYWDNVPPAVKGALEASVGITDFSLFKTISENAEWVRQAPEREQAWQLINVMTQSYPMSDEERASMQAGVAAAVTMLGIEDPVVTTALTSSLEGLWDINSLPVRQALAELAAAGATAVDVDDVTKVINGYTSTRVTLNNEYLNVKPQQIQNSGCATVVQIGSVGADIIQAGAKAGSWKTSAADWNGDQVKADACKALETEYYSLETDLRFVTSQQQYWARFLDSTVAGASGLPEVQQVLGTNGVPAPPGTTLIPPAPAPTPVPTVTPSATTVTPSATTVSPGNTPVPIPAPAAPPPVAPATTNLQPVSVDTQIPGATLQSDADAQKFSALANLYASQVTGEQLTNLENELIEAYGEDAFNAVMNYIFGVTE